MCAITGILAREDAVVPAEFLRRMNDAQAHRGPDEDGVHLEPGLGLGHRRLSIIDLVGGKQPLYNEDDSVVVVYNGEIYNFQALASELVARGHRFRTHCDTEVIVHAWEEWGEGCVERFRGMFAFALWDRAQQVLFLARDRLGIKPLHYAWLADGSLVFASELKALQLHPALPREIAPEAVEEYFAFGYIPAPRTIYAGVHKLPAGHHLTVRRGAARAVPMQYWDVPFVPGQCRDATAAGDELLARLREAVQLRLIADVPLGAFLSGGVDSSAVVALMAQIVAAEGRGPINTCSISFGDPAFNESRHAEAVARRYATAHRTERLDVDRFDLLDVLAGLYDEPFADSSALPTYLVCELARRQVTVALSGDGGDENLAGYKRYQWHLDEHRLRRLMPFGLRRALFGPLGRAYPRLLGAPRPLRAKATFQALARDSVAGYFDIVSVLDDSLRQRLFSQAFKQRLQGYSAVEVLRRHAARSPTDHPLSLVQYLDMKTYLVDDILTKVDRASMAHALEVRVPLLDHELVEWMSSLPPHLKLKGRDGKHLFKSALRAHLPHEIIDRPKMGFAVPLASWLRGPLRARVRGAVLGERLADTGLFERRCLNELLDSHDRGQRDHSAALWSLLMFDAFLKREQGSGWAAAEAA
jgi:asparagine synthase (glutamine-hydrolysing)